MTMNDRLAELERKHHALEEAIVDALAHRSTADTEITELKRQKLHLKEEIERLRQDHKL